MNPYLEIGGYQIGPDYLPLVIAEICINHGGTKEPSKEEQVSIDFDFSTVCTIQPIKAGAPFTKENSWVKRPGTGEILAERFNAVLGKVAKVDLDNNI